MHDNQYLLDGGVKAGNGYFDIKHEVSWLASVLEARDFPTERLARTLDLGAEVILEQGIGAPGIKPALTVAIYGTDPSGVVIVSHMNTGRRRTIQSVREASRHGAKVFYAGNAFTSPRSRRNLPGTYLGTRLQDASRIISQLPG